MSLNVDTAVKYMKTMFDNVKCCYRLHMVITMPCTVHEEISWEDLFTRIIRIILESE